MKPQPMMWEFGRTIVAIFAGILLFNASWLGDGGFHGLVIVGGVTLAWQGVSHMERRWPEWMAAADRKCSRKVGGV